MEFEAINSDADRSHSPKENEVDQQPTTSKGLLPLSEVALRQVYGVIAAGEDLQAGRVNPEVKTPQSIAEMVAGYTAFIIAIRIAHQKNYANSSADGTVVATDSINDLNTRANQGSQSASV